MKCLFAERRARPATQLVFVVLKKVKGMMHWAILAA